MCRAARQRFVVALSSCAATLTHAFTADEREFMSPEVHTPEFPRGFVFADRDVSVPASFERSRLLPYLYVHPWLKAEADVSDGRFVVVLGICHSATADVTGRASSVLLSALLKSEDSFFSQLAWYSGRFAVIFGDAGSSRVVTDATGLRSVFYAESDAVIASHAVLVERALGGKIARDNRPFHFGFPGNRTPYARTKVLSPNTYLDIEKNRVVRFWPIGVLKTRSIDEAASIALAAATTSLQRASMGRRVNVALTAGLDSRVILAVALHSGIEFDTYTYGTDQKTARDRRVAKSLAAAFDLAHTSVDKPEWNPLLRARLMEATYASHHRGVVAGLIDWFGDHRALAVSGNLLEIAQTTFAPWRDKGSAPPATVSDMVALHRTKMNGKTQERIAAFGEEKWTALSMEAFQEFYGDTDFSSTVDRVDPFDLFYWEHRMGLWFGTSMVERDFYSEAFIPFNARGIFEALLGVEEPHRERATAFYRMIEMVDPRLLDIPVNAITVPRRL